MRATLRRARDILLRPVTSRLDAIAAANMAAANAEAHEALLLAIGRAESCRAAAASSLREAEFRIFSQWGEDGIIQHLIHRVPIERPVFVELGVEDYRESNTRFLAENDRWGGLIVDAGDAHVRFLEAGTRYLARWRQPLDAVSAFITRENVNGLLTSHCVTGDIGLLSIDLDGVDYWIAEALTVVQPRIVIAEYISLFGPEAAVTVPYRPDFSRYAAHYSGAYCGASLRAQWLLWSRRGYAFVGCTSAGNDAFFVRRDLCALPELSPTEGYVAGRQRDTRRPDGTLDARWLTHTDQLRLIRDLPIVDVEDGRTMTVAARFGV
jgi:hypothetical protein